MSASRYELVMDNGVPIHRETIENGELTMEN